MDKELLKNAFREYKKAASLAYAITRPDNLGDCQSCVNYALCEKYGEDSKGIWVKHWVHGMNGSGDICEAHYATVAHDLTEEQAKTFYEVFGKYYNITPSAYDPAICFTLYEKDTQVYEVKYTYTDKWADGNWWKYRTERYYSHEKAMKEVFRTLEFMNDPDCGVEKVEVTKIF